MSASHTHMLVFTPPWSNTLSLYSKLRFFTPLFISGISATLSLFLYGQATGVLSCHKSRIRHPSITHQLPSLCNCRRSNLPSSLWLCFLCYSIPSALLSIHTVSLSFLVRSLVGCHVCWPRLPNLRPPPPFLLKWDCHSQELFPFPSPFHCKHGVHALTTVHHRLQLSADYGRSSTW